MFPSKQSGHIRYRAYIDGLRGVAIIAVVLYHAKLLGFTGGFVGVDVFFVISGFLITAIIIRDIKSGSFSLIGFWERRVRRIVPALFVVLLSCSIAAYFLLLYPVDYHHFGNTLIAQSVFASNIVFMLTDNYFDQPSKSSPLLHTWSLSVEEQFYVLFPLIVLCVIGILKSEYIRYRIRKFRNYVTRLKAHLLNYMSGMGIQASSTHSFQPSNMPAQRDVWEGQRLLLIIISILGIVSFAMSVWFVDLASSSALRLPFFPQGTFSQTTFATAGFYLLPTRAWELALGIVLALFAVKIRSRIFSEILSAVGIAAIVLSSFIFSDGTMFPGIAALVPTLGAAAIIVANENHPTKTGAALSLPILVWIGLISYSLYLWHWPVFVFAGLMSPLPLTSLQMVGLIGLSVALGWLSYRFVETPFRKKAILKKRSQLFLCGFAALAVFALIGFFIQRDSAGEMKRIPQAAQILLPQAAEASQWGIDCFQRPGDATQYGGLCRIGDRSLSAKPEFVLWGDSHADALAPLFDAMGRASGIQGVVFDSGSCIPLLGVHLSPPSPDCEKENNTAIQYIHDNNIKRVVLVARWNFYVMGGPDETSANFITDSNDATKSPAAAEAIFSRNLDPMVDELIAQGVEVYIVKDVPEQVDFGTREAFYQAVHQKQNLIAQGVSIVENDTYQAKANSVIDGLANKVGVYIIDPSSLLCMQDSCRLEANGVLLYRDENHLANAGALYLEPLFADFFQSMRHLQ